MKFRLTSRFEKMYRKKPVAMRRQLDWCIEELTKDPRNPRLHVHKMQGTRKGLSIWEAYVDNDGNRLTFEWEGSLLIFRNNCNHDFLYKNP